MKNNHNVVPLTPKTITLSVRRVKRHWWIGRAPGAVFFGRTSSEIVMRHARWRQSLYLQNLRPVRIAEKIITRIHDDQPAEAN